MLKNICAISVFAILIYFFSVMGISLTGQDCIVAKNSSVGGFYYAKNYSIIDEFNSSGKSKTYNVNYNYIKNVVERYNAKIVKVSKIQNVTNYYYYSSNLPNAVYLGGNKINVHIAVSDSQITIGYPLIYYGY